MLKKQLEKLAKRNFANGVKYVTTLDGLRIFEPVYRKRKNLGLPVFYAVKNGNVKVIDGEDGLEMLGRLLDATS